jgi:hypothetical protein
MKNRDHQIMFQDMDSGLSTAPVKNTVLAASSLIMNMKVLLSTDWIAD